MDRKCVCCGSENLITDLKLIDRWDGGEDNSHVSLQMDPSAWVFKGTIRAHIEGEVCDDCGHLQLFVPDRLDLRAANKVRGKNSLPDKSEIGVCSNCKTRHQQEDCPKCGFHAG